MNDVNYYQKLLDTAFRLVSIRPRSEKEIYNALLAKLNKNHISNPLEIEKVIERLKNLKYIDDLAFSSFWIQASRNSRNKGTRVIKNELLLKGVDKDIIDQALSQISTEIKPEIESARIYILKKMKYWQHLPILKQKMKIQTTLISRGYGYGIVRRIIDEVVGKEYNTP